MGEYTAEQSPLREGAYFADEDFTLDVSFYSEQEKERIFLEIDKGVQWRIDTMVSANEKIASGGMHELVVLAFGLTKMNHVLMKDAIQSGYISTFVLEQAMRGVAIATIYRRMQGAFNNKNKNLNFYKKVNAMTSEEVEALIDCLLLSQPLHDELQYFLDHPTEAYTLVSTPGPIGVRLSENPEIVGLLEAGMESAPTKEEKAETKKPAKPHTVPKQTKVAVQVRDDSPETSYAKELLHLVQEFKGITSDEENSLPSLKALERNLSLLETAYKGASDISLDDLESDFLTVCTLIDTYKEALFREERLIEAEVYQLDIANRILRLRNQFSNDIQKPHTHYADWMTLKLVQAAVIDILSQEEHPAYAQAKELLLKPGAILDKVDEMRLNGEFLLQLTGDALREALSGYTWEEILSLNSIAIIDKLGDLFPAISAIIFAQ